MSRIVSDETVQCVRRRAGQLCEYCKRPELLVPFDFEIDHIFARCHGGDDSKANLAWVCANCNAFKGPNLASIDPETGKITVLFHPRRRLWTSHFRLVDGLILPRTAIGRTTVALLRMNNDDAIVARRVYFQWHSMEQ